MYICDKNSSKELVVEARDILDFVANYMRNERIPKLEQMGTNILEVSDMDNRVICLEEQIRTNFLALEMEPDGSEYCVSIDGEIIVWSNDVEDVNDYYKTVKANILNHKYIREGLPVH